jgi:hypothetical protein
MYKALCSLCKNLKNVPVGSLHRGEDRSNEGEGNRFVEDVRHAIDENDFGLAPPQGQIYEVCVQRYLKFAHVPRIAHQL